MLLSTCSVTRIQLEANSKGHNILLLGAEQLNWGLALGIKTQNDLATTEMSQ